MEKDQKGVSVFLPIKKPSALLGKTKLYPLGGSYAIILPKMWLDIFCKHEGVYSVKMDVDGDTITIRPWKEKADG